MKTLTTILKEIWEEKKKFFENIDFYGKKIKRVSQEILGKNIRVILFGSIVKGNWGLNSDIDVLIISENLPESQEERNKIRAKIKSEISPFAPF